MLSQAPPHWTNLDPMSSLKKIKKLIKPDQADFVTEWILMVVSQCGPATAPWDMAVVLNDHTDATHVDC